MLMRNSWSCIVVAVGNILVLLTLNRIRIEHFNLGIRNKENMLNRRFQQHVIAQTPNASKPTALMWTKYYSRWLSFDGQVNITSDRRVFDNVSMVFFHYRDIDSRSLPIHKPVHQLWVLFGWESPYYTYCRKPLRNCHKIAKVSVLLQRIDLVMSYTSDADIYAPYLNAVPRAIPIDYQFTPDAFALKVHGAAILISHCSPHSQRDSYVRELKRYFDVHVYGRCRKGVRNNMTTKAIFDHFQRNYQFYLAFENSICPEYVTEKAFNALSTDIIPVVLGGADYQQMLPPNSYINALSFESPRELARHLDDIGRNFTRYRAFLEWKRRFSVDGRKYASRQGKRFVYMMITKTVLNPPIPRAPADIRRRISALSNNSLCQPWQALLNSSFS